MRRKLLLSGILFCCIAAANAGSREQVLHRKGQDWTLRVPAGLQLELLSDRLDAPRLLTFLPNGDLLCVFRRPSYDEATGRTLVVPLLVVWIKRPEKATDFRLLDVLTAVKPDLIGRLSGRVFPAALKTFASTETQQ